MNILYSICTSISVGIMIGFVIGGFKLALKKQYTEAQRRLFKNIIDKASGVLRYITFLLLALGLVWCIYFLVLGVSVPEQTDYANSMAELIVSVLTVISIIFLLLSLSRDQRINLSKGRYGSKGNGKEVGK